MQQKTPSKLAVFFIFQKDILGIISPCKLPKIPSKLGDFVTKKEIFLTLKAPSGVRTRPLLTALCICKKPIFYSGGITFCLPSSSS
ncbi:MAG: hypothetical protein J6M26_03840, partial [Clostridia bacterium]|nr:hypothetical protein [Clostridia bacterium]